LRDNISAIRGALEYKEGTTVSKAGAAILRKYSGFGGIKAVLFPAGEKSDVILLDPPYATAKAWDCIKVLFAAHSGNSRMKYSIASIRVGR
jgi:23S rRNA A2030 N6-methylase RlmJ